ncbi:MAG: MFS transporter [Weeksellaceae bacterium]
MNKRPQISPRNIKLYYVTQFLHALIFTIPIFIVFLSRILTPAQISFLIGWQYAIQFLTEMPTGALADLFGKKTVIIIGFAIGAIGSVLFSVADSFIHFLVLFSLIGLSDSFLSGSVEAWIYDSLKQDGIEKSFEKVLANQGVLYQIGLIVGTGLGGFLYTISPSFPYVLYSVALGLGALVSCFMYEPFIDTVQVTLQGYIEQLKKGLHEILLPRLRALSLFYILVGGISWSCALYFNQYVLLDVGFDAQMRGIIEASLRVFNIVLLKFIVDKTKLSSGRAPFIVFPALMIVSLLPGVALNQLIAIPFVAGAMLSSTARWIILGNLVNKELDSRYRATALSVLSMFIGMIYITVTMISGPIIAFGGARLMFSILGILSLIFILPLGLKLYRK